MIVAFDGERVIYVIERNGIRPVWNKAKWLTTRRDAFAQEVSHGSTSASAYKPILKGIRRRFDIAQSTLSARLVRLSA
jgi:hypothetical protein